METTKKAICGGYLHGGYLQGSSAFSELIPGPLLPPDIIKLVKQFQKNSLTIPFFMKKYKTRTKVSTPQFGNASIGEGIMLI